MNWYSFENVFGSGSRAQHGKEFARRTRSKKFRRDFFGALETLIDQMIPALDQYAAVGKSRESKSTLHAAQRFIIF